MRQACPDLPPVTDGSAIGIASADSDTALDYRKCSARHDAAVSSFDALAGAYQELRDAITKGVKKGRKINVK